MVAAQISRLAAVSVVSTITSKNLDADVFIRKTSSATYLLKLTHSIKHSFINFRTRGSNQGGRGGCLRAVSHIYTGCPRRNVPNFGRVFLMLRYTDITQNTYVQI